MRSDIAIILSSVSGPDGRTYKLYFDHSKGWPTRYDVLGKMRTLMGEELFNSCEISDCMKVGECTIEVTVTSNFHLPERFPYRGMSGEMRRIKEDSPNSVLVQTGDVVEFARGAARFSGIVRKVGDLSTPHEIHNTDEGETEFVPVTAVLSVEAKAITDDLSPEDIVKQQLLG